MTDNSELRLPGPQVRPDAPGKIILLVTSILLIVHGSYWLHNGFEVIQFILLGMPGPSLGRILIFNIFPSAFKVLVGIIGLAISNNIEKTGRLQVLGMALLGVEIFFITRSIFVGTFSFGMIGAMRIILPIGYIYGARRNFKAWKEKLAVPGDAAMTGNSELNTQEVQAQPRPDAPGRKMLKVTGMLLLIFGCISFSLNYLAMNNFLTGRGFFRGSTFEIVFMLIVSMLASAFQVYAGAIGTSYCNNVEKAGRLWAAGIILLVALVLATAVNLAFGATVNLGTVIGVVLPVIYLVGAQKNLEAKKAQADQCREVQP